MKLAERISGLGLSLQPLLREMLSSAPVRQRYILTRSNRLRLRYIILPLGFLCLTTGLAGFSSDSQAIPVSGPAATMAEARPPVPADITDGLNGLEEQRALSQKRLQRYEQAPAATEENNQNGTLELAIHVPKAPPEPPRRPEPRVRTLTIGKGDTLAGVLQQAGLSGSLAYQAVHTLQEYYDPRQLRPGQTLNLHYTAMGENGWDLAEMRINVDPLKSIRLQRTEDGAFEYSQDIKDVERRIYTRKAEIEHSLYGSAAEAGVPLPLIAETIHIYSWDVDFQRDIRRGDSLEVMYEQLETPEGIKVKNGDILYAHLSVNGQDIKVYRFERDNGDVDYYTADGKSIRKALLKTPVDGARLSSGYGRRKHPVLGYTKMHKGLDFAAPRGTPIYAAGDGTVERANRWGSFGNYVRIRHNSSIKTAYAHLNGFAKGIEAGKRVKQGQVIGYIGTTGRSTGPHLHYEVLKNGAQVDPRSIDMPHGDTLTGKQLQAFKAHIKNIDRQYVEITERARYAALQ